MFTSSKPIPINGVDSCNYTTPPMMSPMISPPMITPFPLSNDNSDTDELIVNDGDFVDTLYDEILEAHRCRACARFTCCSNLIHHSSDCWAENYRGDLTTDDVKNIHKYRWGMMNNICEDYDEELREESCQDDHISFRFRVPRVGFYVRCFRCKFCFSRDGNKCHVKFHNHV